jgi:hypothetical protein|tara:strand:+ start:393 stop:857 length:465 start_codon:yes stop_codon:yes gene_type:complete
MNKLKQYKLSSGDEIVCEVVDFTDEGIIARKVIQIDTMILEDGVRAYVMRPWMLYQDGIDQYTIINNDNVAASAMPTQGLIHQYYTTLMTTLETYHDRETHGDITDDELQDLLTDIEYNNHHYETYAPNDDESIEADSDQPKRGNVLYLDPIIH